MLEDSGTFWNVLLWGVEINKNKIDATSRGFFLVSLLSLPLSLVYRHASSALASPPLLALLAQATLVAGVGVGGAVGPVSLAARPGRDIAAAELATRHRNGGALDDHGTARA